MNQFMGVNPYNPYGLPMQNPYMMQQPQQIQQTPQQQSVSAPQEIGPDWAMAPTIQDVEHVQVQPGGKAWIMVQNDQVFALRVADQMGLIKTDYYRFEKIDPSESETQKESKFVTREEFDKFVESLKGAEKK